MKIPDKGHSKELEVLKEMIEGRVTNEKALEDAIDATRTAFEVMERIKRSSGVRA